MITQFAEQSFLQFTLQHEWGTAIAVKETLADGTLMEIWDSGVICFTPKQEATPLDLVLSSAVHGDETAPIEICDSLIEAIRSGELQLRTRVLFLIANPAAINIGKRFVEENMNRLFSGAHSKGDVQNRERVRAQQLEGYVRSFFEGGGEQRQRMHYDMHTAIRDSKHEKFAVYPYQNGKPYRAQQLRLLAALDVPVVLLHDGPTTTFSYFSVNEFGADAFTLELGKVRPFGQNEMQKFAQTKQQLLQLLTQGCADNDSSGPALAEHNLIIYKVLRSINRTEQAFRLSFSDDLANFTAFRKGDLLAEDGNMQIYAEVDGEAVIFPNANVAIGQRALLTVTAIDVSTMNIS